MGDCGFFLEKAYISSQYRYHPSSLIGMGLYNFVLSMMEERSLHARRPEGVNLSGLDEQLFKRNLNLNNARSGAFPKNLYGADFHTHGICMDQKCPIVL